MKVTLPNGVVAEGTETQIKDIMKTFGFTGTNDFYVSSSKGLITIRDMEDTHLKNAIRRAYIKWVEGLKTTKTNKEFLQDLRQGAVDPTLLSLVKELGRRL